MRHIIRLSFNSIIIFAGLILFLGLVTCQKLNFKKILKIETNDAENITIHGVVLNGAFKHYGEEDVLVYGHCWSTSSNPIIGVNQTMFEGGNEVVDYKSTIDNLEPSTTYYFRAYATNDEGTVYGEDKTFTTYAAVDFDDNYYRSVQIGNQIWLSENIRSIHYSDGQSIDNGSLAGDISYQFTSEYYFSPYNNDKNIALHGRLYTAMAARRSAASSNENPSGVQGICPAGWHLPSDSEWEELEAFLGMPSGDLDAWYYRGSDEGDQLKNQTSFQSPSTGNNQTGFNALASGTRMADGNYNPIGIKTCYWSSTQEETWTTIARALEYSFGGIYLWHWENDNAFSVRCIKDK